METQNAATTVASTNSTSNSPNARAETRQNPASEPARKRVTVTPAVDVYENTDEILLVVDLPGVRQGDVTLDLHDERLTVHATRAYDATGRLVAAEFGPRDYHRVFVVPQGFDRERIDAQLTDGVLRVHLPKSAALKPRRIAVKGA